MTLFSFLLRCACFLPILVLIVAINVGVDPAHVFRAEPLSRTVSAILLTDQHAARADQSDMRLTVRYYFEGVSATPEVVVAGSSRAMNVRQKNISAGRLFNASVNSGGFEDVVAVTALSFRKDSKPRTIVIGADPWFLNARNPHVQWDKWSDLYFEGVRRFGLEDPREHWRFIHTVKIPDRWVAALSFSYFQESFKAALGRWRNGPVEAPIEPIGIEEAAFVIRRSDGSVSYSEAMRSADVAYVNQLAHRYADGMNVDYFEDFVEPDPALLKRWEGLLSAMKVSGVEPVLFLAPFHPYVYQRLTGSFRHEILWKTEQIYRLVAAKQDVKVFGSFNPAEYDCDESEFYDGLHAKESCVDKIFESGPSIAR